MACVLLPTKNTLIDVVQPVDEFVPTLGEAVAQLVTMFPKRSQKSSRICAIP